MCNVSVYSGKKLLGPWIDSTTCWLKDGRATNFAKELSPLARAVITQASHRTPYHTLPHSNLCFSPNTGHPPCRGLWNHPNPKPNPCLYWNTVSLALGDSNILGANVVEEKLPRPGIKPTTVWLKDGRATNFAEELSPLARAVITQASHRTSYYMYITSLLRGRGTPGWESLTPYVQRIKWRQTIHKWAIFLLEILHTF